MRQGFFREFPSYEQPFNSATVHDYSFFSSPDKAGATYVTVELVDEVIVVSKRKAEASGPEEPHLNIIHNVAWMLKGFNT